MFLAGNHLTPKMIPDKKIWTGLVVLSAGNGSKCAEH